MKKIISLLLSVALLLSLSTPALALEISDKCMCGHAPTIYITGFAMTDLVKNPGTDEAYDVFMPEMDKVTETVKGLILPILTTLFFHTHKLLGHALAKAANTLLAEVACDNNGVPIDPDVDIRYRNAPSSYHGTYSSCTFRYDWREDVFDIAKELYDYIEETKRLTRHDKVVLKAESMGGAVLMTYLKQYGHDSVDTIIMQSSAFNGIRLVGGIFTGDLDFKAKEIAAFAGDFIEGNENDMNFYRLLIQKLGPAVIRPIAWFLDVTFTRSREILYTESLRSLFGNIPGVWVFVPQEKYEEAKKFMLDEEKNAVLIEKIDRYHYGVMDSTKEILDDAMKDGVKLAIISNYGKGAVPVTSDAGYQSDFLIDTARTSMGAVCADFGKTLGKDYKQAVEDGHNHLSCDNVIDASTCVYPEYTWFVKDMIHTWYSGGYYDFARWIASCPTQPTVHDSPLYPQFMVNNHDTRTLDPLTHENENTLPTNVDWKALFQYFKEILQSRKK